MSNVRSRYSLGVGKSLLIADRPNHPCMSSSELSMRIRNRWSELKGRASVIVLLFVTLGCSTLDPQNVGSGQYLQILQGELVISEVDTSNAGMLNCPNQAYQTMQANPSLVGRVKCSSIPSQAPLPYSFRAHRQLTPSDGYKPASPYLIPSCVQYATNRQCTMFSDLNGIWHAPRYMAKLRSKRRSGWQELRRA